MSLEKLIELRTDDGSIWIDPETIKAIVDAQMQQWMVLRQNKTLNGKQKIEKMREINADAQGRIDKVLTSQQRQKLQAIMEQGKPPAGRPRPKRNKPAPKEEE